MLTACLLLIPLALMISLPLTRLCRGAAHRMGHLDTPEGRKLHARPMPVTGGIAIFWAIIGPMLAGLAALWLMPEETWQRVLPGVVEHLPYVKSHTGLAVALLGSVGALHAMGIVDDRKNLGPMGKLAIQFVAAIVLAVAFELRVMEFLGVLPSAALAVLWLVVITNAMNFLDNMDGLSAGVATISAAIMLAIALMGAQWFVAAVLALMIGALLGFLWFNFPPASIFMGDAGSLVIGFLLAFCALRLTYVEMEPGAVASSSWWALFTPVVVLAIPLYDLTSVCVIRIRKGISPFQGDRRHFSHRLVNRGLSERAAVGTIYACALATGIGGILLGRVPGWAAALVVAQIAAILLVLALMEFAGNGNGEK